MYVCVCLCVFIHFNIPMYIKPALGNKTSKQTAEEAKIWICKLRIMYTVGQWNNLNGSKKTVNSEMFGQGHKTDHGTDTAHSHWVCIYTRALCVALIWVCLWNGPTQTTQMGHISLNKKRQKIDHPEVMLCLFCKVCVSFLLSTAGLSFNTTEPFKVLAYNPFKGAAVQLKLKIRSSNKASK